MTKQKISYKHIEAKEKCFIAKELNGTKSNSEPQSDQTSETVEEEHSPQMEKQAKEIEKEYEEI